jgi:hypothetical protein
MNFLRKRVSYRDYLKLLERAEAQVIDFKDKRIQPSRLSNTISALANADGGEIFVGITELAEHKFAWDGFKNEEETNEIIKVVEDMLYLNCHYGAEFLEWGEKGLVLRLIINKSSKVIHTPAKKVFRRRNAQNIELKTVEEIRQLELNKGAFSYEDFPVSIGLDEISTSTSIYEFLLDNCFDVEPEDFLQKNNLVEEGKPRVSGLLLFSDALVVDHCLHTLDRPLGFRIHPQLIEVFGLCICAPAAMHPIGAELFFDRGGKILVALLMEGFHSAKGPGSGCGGQGNAGGVGFKAGCQVGGLVGLPVVRRTGCGCWCHGRTELGWCDPSGCCI